MLTVVSGVFLCRFAAWPGVAFPLRLLPGKKPPDISEGKTIKVLAKFKVHLHCLLVSCVASGLSFK